MGKRVALFSGFDRCRAITSRWRTICEEVILVETETRSTFDSYFSPHDGQGNAAEPFRFACPIKHWTDRLYLSAVLGRKCDYQLNPMERVGLLRSRG
jgi:hypothetical protein